MDLRRPKPKFPESIYSDFRKTVARLEWRAPKTANDVKKSSYTVRLDPDQDPYNNGTFCWLAQLIYHGGVDELYKWSSYKVVYMDNFKYWLKPGDNEQTAKIIFREELPPL